jgi:hypothetical protein
MDSPTKYSVRAWMQHRQRQQAPLPDIAQIRRELGWNPARPAPAPSSVGTMPRRTTSPTIDFP